MSHLTCMGRKIPGRLAQGPPLLQAVSHLPPPPLKSDPKQLSRPSHEGETRDPGLASDKKLSCGVVATKCGFYVSEYIRLIV